MSFINKMPRYEILSEESMATLTLGWKRIVSEIGIEFINAKSIFNLGAKPVHARQEDVSEREKQIGQLLRQY